METARPFEDARQTAITLAKDAERLLAAGELRASLVLAFSSLEILIDDLIPRLLRSADSPDHVQQAFGHLLRGRRTAIHDERGRPIFEALTGRAMPRGLKEELSWAVKLRNGAVHRGEHPTPEDVRRAFATLSAAGHWVLDSATERTKRDAQARGQRLLEMEADNAAYRAARDLLLAFPDLRAHPAMVELRNAVSKARGSDGLPEERVRSDEPETSEGL